MYPKINTDEYPVEVVQCFTLNRVQRSRRRNKNRAIGSAMLHE